jgi:hypothetical protein
MPALPPCCSQGGIKRFLLGGGFRRISDDHLNVRRRSVLRLRRWIVRLHRSSRCCEVRCKSGEVHYKWAWERYKSGEVRCSWVRERYMWDAVHYTNHRASLRNNFRSLKIHPAASRWAASYQEASENMNWRKSLAVSKKRAE